MVEAFVVNYLPTLPLGPLTEKQRRARAEAILALDVRVRERLGVSPAELEEARQCLSDKKEGVDWVRGTIKQPAIG